MTPDLVTMSYIANNAYLSRKKWSIKQTAITKQVGRPVVTRNDLPGRLWMLAMPMPRLR